MYNAALLDNGRLALEAYEFDPSNFPFNSGARIWYFETIDHPENAQFIEISGPRLTRITWRPTPDSE
jgi:hypothetical protein